MAPWPVLPDAETIADGIYPLADSLTLYVRPDAQAVARGFCDFATGPEGAQIAKRFGLWPAFELGKAGPQFALRY